MKYNINHTLYDFPIVILCGGKSSRMQQDKSLLPFDKYDSLVQFQYERLEKEFKRVFLSSKNHKFNFLPEGHEALIFDENSEVFSPLVGLKSILEKVDDKVFILTVDTPFVKIETIKAIIEKSINYEITIASTPFKTHNLCGVFSKRLLPKIEKMLDENIHKINYLIKQSNSVIIDFMDEDEFLNLNNPSDYEKALEILKGIK